MYRFLRFLNNDVGHILPQERSETDTAKTVLELALLFSFSWLLTVSFQSSLSLSSPGTSDFSARERRYLFFLISLVLGDLPDCLSCVHFAFHRYRLRL